MAITDLGRVSVVLKGEYSSIAMYEELDVVTYDGSSYICRSSCAGINPTNTTYWQLCAVKGNKGDKGDKGDRGQQGNPGIVQDVMINSSSILSGSVANIPLANENTPGAVKVDSDFGILMNAGFAKINAASSPQIKAGEQPWNPVTPAKQHESAFYGLAKAAGDSTQQSSGNAVGTYTDGAKNDIQNMLNVPDASCLGIVCSGDTAPMNIATGKYVVWHGKLYTASTDIISGTVLSDGNLDEVTDGGLNNVGGGVDVQINGTSIVNQGVANVPIIGVNKLGVALLQTGYGIMANASGKLQLVKADDNQIKDGAVQHPPIVPSTQHKSVFYGLAKAANDTTQSASSNPVGTYTDSAKVAIQKMLGVYEAPWEVIISDTFTNDTEADYEITADSNGASFELTDIRILFWLPQQDTASAKGDYGRLLFYYDSANADTVFCGAWTQAANATARICGGEIIQNDNMATITQWKNAALNSDVSAVNTLRVYPYENSQIWKLLNTPRIYNKIKISKVTGTGAFVVYGKRKWQ